jgi:hypothetical protein
MARQLSWILLIAGVLLTWTGCEIITEGAPDPPPDIRPAGTVVINEVFTLPPTNPSYHSWIEFLNAGDTTVDVTYWTLGMTTSRLELQTIGELVVSPDTVFFNFFQQRTLPDGFGSYDVPIFAENLLLEPGQQPPLVIMQPQDLRTYVNIESRLLSITRWGPGNAPGDRREDVTLFLGPFFRIDTLDISLSSDSLTTTYLLNLHSYAYSFFLATTDQLVLKNGAGQVVDVVRYGAYVWPGPGADPYPGNQSIGLIPEFESIARYAGGYFTGNTANDFYITNEVVRPVPHWYSAVLKPQ